MANYGVNILSGPSLVLDSQGRPHLSFILAALDSARSRPNEPVTTGAVAYARPKQMGWKLEVVDAPGTVVHHVVLALDHEDCPHIAYSCGTREHSQGQSSQLRYACQDHAAWQTTVIGPMCSGTRPGLALDAQGGLHIAYPGPDDAGRRPYYAQLTESGWVTDTPTASDHVTIDVLLAVDAQSRPHLVYVNNPEVLDDPEWRHVFRTAGGWHTEIVDTLNEARAGLGAMIFEDTRLHLIYQAGTTGMRYACRIQGLWGYSRVNLETSGSDVIMPGLALHPLGHLVLVGEDGDDLILAEQEGAIWQQRGSIIRRWQRNFWPRLVVDRQGHYHVAYLDMQEQGIGYAYYDGSGWQHRIVAQYMAG